MEYRTKSGKLLTDEDVEKLADEACRDRQESMNEPCSVCGDLRREK
jgi:hypothetical protein